MTNNVLSAQQQKNLKAINQKVAKKAKNIKYRHGVDIAVDRGVVIKTEFGSQKEYAKYRRDMNKNVLDRKALNYRRINPDLSVRKEVFVEYEKLAKDYNKSLKKRKKDVLKHIETVLGETARDDVAKIMKANAKRKPNRMTAGVWDDLEGIDIKSSVSKMSSEKDIKDWIDKLKNNPWYNLKERDQQYVQNWIEGMYNSWGENSITRQIERDIKTIGVKSFVEESAMNPATKIFITEIYPTAYDDEQDQMQIVSDFIARMARGENPYEKELM